jgi:2-hydroxymuconate-semialdehyde hydrolase
VRIEERGFEVAGIAVRYWEGGAGMPLLLIHGSGPGASTLGYWRLMLEPLATHFHVIAADLIGFGLSGRKPAPPFFDIDLWLRQCHAMLALFGDNAVGVVGHSISATLALRMAATDKRVAKVMTTGAMGAHFLANEDTRKVWTFPETRENLRDTAHCLFYDKSTITDEYLDGRMKVLHSGGYGDYFRAMFAGEKQAFIDAAVVSPTELAAVACPVLMLHGRDDRPFPFAQTTLELARALPHADIVALAHCGHSPALEHPKKLLAVAREFFESPGTIR